MRHGFWTPLVLGSVLAALIVAPAPASAQLAGTATILFSMPQNIDPVRHKVFRRLNDPLHISVEEFLQGFELHARVPGATKGTWEDVTGIQFKFVFDGTAV